MHSMHVKAVFSLLLISLMFLSVNQVGVVVSAGSTFIYASPATINASSQAIGYRFPVFLNVTNAPGTYAWDVVLRWNPSILNVTSILAGDFLSRGGAFQTTLIYSYPADLGLASQWGNLTLGQSLAIGYPMDQWATGDGWLVRLGFGVKATGSTAIDLSGTVLYDRLEAGTPSPTAYPNVDCFFFNTQFHDFAVSNVTASPNEVRAEELVSINVTVSNLGNFTETSDVAVYADTEVTDPANPDVVLIGDEITVGTKTVSNLASGSSTTLSYTWNTTGVEDGNFTISAQSLFSDNNPSNNIFIDSFVVVGPPAMIHDVAVISVAASPADVKAGDSVTVSVEVENLGDFNETFSVAAYADKDTTVLGDEITIGTNSSVALANGTSTTLTFTWDTKSVDAGTYTISAKVPPVASEREADKANNTKAGNTVKVQGIGGPDYTLYIVAAVIVIVIVAAVALYFFRFRKK